jgi:hypothetical protein
MPGLRNHPGAWGTAEDPLVMSPLGWVQLHKFLKARMVHVHLYYGQPDAYKCVLHRYDNPCWGGEQIAAETLETGFEVPA